MNTPPPKYRGLKALLSISLAALALPSVAAETTVISSLDIASTFNSSGSNLNQGGFGGGTSLSSMFDGNFKNGLYTTGLNNGGSIVLDFTSLNQNGYFVTEVAIGTVDGTFRYSLDYSQDGSTWEVLPHATNIKYCGTAEYGVFKTVKKIRLTSVDTSQWCPFFSEFQVKGIDPDDMACTHTVLSDWSAISDSATCTHFGREQAVCQGCGETFVRYDNEVAPLGHDYQSQLDQPGKAWRYGVGFIRCSRCDFTIDCSEPVDAFLYGGLACNDVVQFANLSVSSTRSIQDGNTRPQLMFDGNKNSNWMGGNWDSPQEYVDIVFGTTVDLVKFDFTVPNNRTHTFRLYKLDGAKETLLDELQLLENDVDGDYHGGSFEFIGEGDQTGLRVEALRIRNVNGNWTFSQISEVHPFITVLGAGKLDPGPPMFLLMQ